MCLGEGMELIDSILARIHMICLFENILYIIFFFLKYLVSCSGSRDRIVVSTLRCGRNNPGSNPGHGTFFFLLLTNVYFYSS